MPKFFWRYVQGIGYCLMYEGNIGDATLETGHAIAMIRQQSDHVHVLSPLTFLCAGKPNVKEAMEWVQKELGLFADRVQSSGLSNRLWPVVA